MSQERRLRVLYYNHTSDVSGAEISLLTTITQLRDKLDLLLAAPEGELLNRARKLGLPVCAVQGYSARMSANPVKLLRGLIGTYRTGRALRGVLRDFRPDIVHANSIRAGLIAAVATRNQPVRLVWHVRDNLPQNLLGRVIRRIAQKRTDAVVAISRAIANNFATRPRLKSKTHVVYNGVRRQAASWVLYPARTGRATGPLCGGRSRADHSMETTA